MSKWLDLRLLPIPIFLLGLYLSHRNKKRGYIFHGGGNIKTYRVAGYVVGIVMFLVGCAYVVIRSR
jgi:hypothetical protein